MGAMKLKLLEAMNFFVSKFESKRLDAYDEDIDEDWGEEELEVEDEDYFIVDEGWAVRHASEASVDEESK